MAKAQLFENEAFNQHFKNLFKDEYDAFVEAVNAKPNVSVRRNLHKPIGALPFELSQPVEWCSHAGFVDERPAFWADPFHHAGAYYVQDSSSMFFANAIDFSKDLLVLDLCAAPGGKSTLLLDYLSENSLLVSNELDIKRNQVLVENLARWGVPNSVVTNSKASDFEKLGAVFDVVVVDAPCSGEGMFRKDIRTVEQWSPGFVRNCELAQQEILGSIDKILKPGGLLVYSTCTYEPSENEQQLQNLFASAAFEPVEIATKPEWYMEKREFDANGGAFSGYYFYLHKTPGEGQYVCVARKIGEERNSTPKTKGFRKAAALPVEFANCIPPTYQTIEFKGSIYALSIKYAEIIGELQAHFPLWKLGVRVGSFKGKDFVPDHEFAMSTWLLNFETVELNYEQALSYLRREPVQISVAKGQVLLSYKQLPLGWGKSLGNRINNQFPKHLKLRK
ncbi:MAG: tRNA/rRNA cytosine-C5-methylase [Bacteroidetes bacterium]|nr:tRNA/rRNA cytosine-C5-methylase [Bacteroidota bacterium]